MKHFSTLLFASFVLLGPGLPQDAQPPRATNHRPVTLDRSEWNGPPLKRVSEAPPRDPAQWVPANPRAQAEPRTQPKLSGAAPKPDRSILYWDEQPGQPIWVRGSDYKASFGPDGFQFIPFLGSQAPQNFPLALNLIEVRSGDSHWGLESPARVQRAQDEVRLDHGGVQVSYQVAPQSVEQFFHLGEVRAQGPIELTLAWNSELHAEPHGQGWRFANEWGGVTYSHAIVFDEAGQTRMLAARLTEDRLSLTVPADFVQAAQGALTIDPVLTTFAIDGFAGLHLSRPDVAYSYPNDLYCVVYEESFSSTDSDIYSIFVDGQTDVPSNGAYINVNAAKWASPSIAYQLNDDRFMIVATASESTTVFERGIRSRSRNSIDSTVTPEIVIEAPTASYTCQFPDIGGDTLAGPTSYFCIVWERNYGTDRDIAMALYTGTGAVHLAPSILHSSVSYDLISPKVSKSTGGLWGNSIFNVAWSATALTSGLDNGVLVQQVSWDGSLINNRFFAVTDPTDIFGWLDVSEGVAETDGSPGGGGRYYLVVFDNVNSTDLDFGAVLCAKDQVIDSIALPMSEHVSLIPDRDHPCIATTAESWIVGHAESSNTVDWTVGCTVLQPVVGKLGLSETPFTARTVVDNTTQYQGLGFASTVSGGAPFAWRDALLASHEEVGSDQYIQGARLYAQGTDPAAGYQYCYGEANSTGERALIYAWGNNSTTGIKEIRTERLPTNQFCYLLSGSAVGYVPNPGGSDGDLCLGGVLGRYNVGSEIGFTGPSGHFVFDVHPAAIRQAGGNTVGMAGQTWYFQTWFRDSAAGVGHSNFSNGVAIPLE